jgi:hypothetical protein
MIGSINHIPAPWPQSKSKKIAPPPLKWIKEILKKAFAPVPLLTVEWGGLLDRLVINHQTFPQRKPNPNQSLTRPWIDHHPAFSIVGHRASLSL